MFESVQKELASEIAKLDTDAQEMLNRALALAEKAHAGQFRMPKSARPDHRDPYLIHPMRVALILMREAGLREPTMIAGALLHDVVEDSDGLVTVADIEHEFGPEVANIVALLSKPERRPDIDRHTQLSVYHNNIAAASERVRSVKLADRLDNIREALVADDPKFQNKYLNETREIYLPLAAATSEMFHHEIADACRKLETHLNSGQLSGVRDQGRRD